MEWSYLALDINEYKLHLKIKKNWNALNTSIK
jgi:hypothetical protein